MSNSGNTTPNHDRPHTTYDPHRADPKGAYIASAGVLVFVVATFLAWITTDDKSFSGYETDTVIPFTAYFGIGLAAALLYAAKRATRRQHRGLSLTSMAAGIAATGLSLSYLLEVPGGAERKAGFDTEIGVYVGLVGAIIWAVGSFMLATEPEGDVEHRDADHRSNDARGTTGR
jgi:ABC-type Fe3+-siderophore transport system permease subunit